MTRIYKDDANGNPVDVTDMVISVPRGIGLSDTVNARIANREPEVQYLKLGQDGETVTYYFDEADELPSDDLLDAMVLGMEHLQDRRFGGMDLTPLEERALEHWGPDIEPGVYKTEYGYTGGGMRWKAKAGSKAKALAKRRARNKAARKARARTVR